jgi:hypothetical protein
VTLAAPSAVAPPAELETVDFLKRLLGDAGPEPSAAAPAPADVLDRLDALLAEGVATGRVPPLIQARVARVTGALRDILPRIDQLGPGSAAAHTVVATATSYLPEAVGAYLRLPRDFADNRPVDGAKTSLMVLCDQLDLLAAKMGQVYIAVCRADADALIAHGRFLAAKFGPGGDLALGPAAATSTPPAAGPTGPTSAAQGSGA